VNTRLRPGSAPTKRVTFRATTEQRAAYKRTAAATRAKTLSRALTKVLDARVTKVELDLDWQCASHPRNQVCPQCATIPRPRKRR
jgi:hypothetical protein